MEKQAVLFDSDDKPKIQVETVAVIENEDPPTVWAPYDFVWEEGKGCCLRKHVERIPTRRVVIRPGIEEWFFDDPVES